MGLFEEQRLLAWLLGLSGAFHGMFAWLPTGTADRPVRIVVQHGQTTVRLKAAAPTIPKPAPRHRPEEVADEPEPTPAPRARPPERVSRRPDPGDVLALAEPEPLPEPPPERVEPTPPRDAPEPTPREIARRDREPDPEPPPPELVMLPTDASAATASAQATGRADAPPRVVFNPLPPYPAEAGGRFGKPILKVRIAADGRPLEVEVERSCGVAALDDSARRTVLTSWRFEPAQRQGIAVETVVRFGVDFYRNER